VKYGDALKAAREGAEMTQQQLAEELGCSRQFICDLEKGRRSPPALMAIRIWDTLGDAASPEPLMDALYTEKCENYGVKPRWER